MSRYSNWLVAVIGSVFFVIIGLRAMSRESGENRNLHAENGNHGYLIEFLKKHPDPKISVEMYGEWERGEFWVVEEDLPPGAGGAFQHLPADEATSLYGMKVLGDVQPMLLLSSSKIELSKSDDLAARSLMKTIRHEYEHYLQWKKGKYFQYEIGEVSAEERCQELWSREFPVYRDDCYRAERWWPGKPSIFPDNRCSYKEDPIRFGKMVARLLGDFEPQCLSIWDRMIEERAVLESIK